MNNFFMKAKWEQGMENAGVLITSTRPSDITHATRLPVSDFVTPFKGYIYLQFKISPKQTSPTLLPG